MLRALALFWLDVEGCRWIGLFITGWFCTTAILKFGCVKALLSIGLDTCEFEEFK